MLIEHHKIPEEQFGGAFPAADLFCGLSPESQNSLRAVKHAREFAPDETVFESGQLPCRVYILTGGEAQIFHHGGTRVQRVKQGEILGLPEAFADLPYETSLKTVTPCRFESIDRDAFLAFLQNEPAICFRLLQMLGANLHKLYRLLR